MPLTLDPEATRSTRPACGDYPEVFHTQGRLIEMPRCSSIAVRRDAGREAVALQLPTRKDE
jgi:hypothetical protein